MVVNSVAKIGSCTGNIANMKWCVEIVGKSVTVKISSISPVKSTVVEDSLPSLTPHSKDLALIDQCLGQTLLTTLTKKDALKGLF